MNKFQPPFLRSEYNYDTLAASNESALHTPKDEAGAKQSFKDECDINTIVKRHGLGYELPNNPSIPQYGDFTNVTDFHTAMSATARAHEQFEAMPAHIRSRFDNDTGKFVDFCSNPENLGELQKMGLLNQEAIERLKKTDEEGKKTTQNGLEHNDQGGGTSG